MHAEWKALAEAPEVHRHTRMARTAVPSLVGEVERLRIAIAWALGESPEGVPEFEPRGEGQPPYWWRTQLRKLARP